uniref:Zinc knuckle CX2CX4HX4C domain-containing protein n=1 Tax=Chenopodium quinoa TaxID=63459 RepID=A0A803KXJ6_CHEQI
MWVRLMDVPLNKRSISVMYDIGEFIELDESDPLGWSESMRIKVLVDINKPLRRGLFLATDQNSSRWIDVKYERLADFCFFCGRLDHTEKECQHKEQAKGSEPMMVYQYGPWLRASPKKKTRIDMAEREFERAWIEKLRQSAGSKKAPSYNDPNVIKLGPVGAARKLVFSPTMAHHKPDIPKSPVRKREAELRVVKGEGSMNFVLRTMGKAEREDREFGAVGEAGQGKEDRSCDDFEMEGNDEDMMVDNDDMDEPNKKCKTVASSQNVAGPTSWALGGQ